MVHSAAHECLCAGTRHGLRVGVLSGRVVRTGVRVFVRDGVLLRVRVGVRETTLVFVRVRVRVRVRVGILVLVFVGGIVADCAAPSSVGVSVCGVVAVGVRDCVGLVVLVAVAVLLGRGVRVRVTVPVCVAVCAGLLVIVGVCVARAASVPV